MNESSENDTSVRITLQNVRAHRPHSSNHGPPGLPLSEVGPRHFLIGDLRISIGGRRVGAFGYDGPNEVYLCQWLRSLKEMTEALRRSDPSAYEWWYYEQGDPELSFRRAGTRVTLRAVEDEGRGGHEEYSCELDELTRAVDDVLDDLSKSLARDAGKQGTDWFARNILPGPNPNSSPERHLISSTVRDLWRWMTRRR